MSFKLRISSNFYFSRYRHIYNRIFSRRSHIHNGKNINTTLISGLNYPVCIDCKYFMIPEYSEKSEYDNDLGKCALYGNKNLITGKIYNCFATTCRGVESKCGEKGRFFTKK